jgi:hypothetical protein
MATEKFETDDFSAHDLELITLWTGAYFGSPEADPYKLNRALYVLGHRKLGLDTKMKYEHTAPLRMKDISSWADDHWIIGHKETDEIAVESVDTSPKAGTNTEDD